MKNTVQLIPKLLLAAMLAYCSAKQQRGKTETLLWLDYFGNCPKSKNLPLRFNVSGVERVGRTSMGYGTLVNDEQAKMTDKSIVVINHCRDKTDGSCELFATWRFGAETCSMFATKNAMWSQIVNYNPPLVCPFKKGVYTIRNATVQLKYLSQFQFPLDGYWKINVDIFSTEKQIFCFTSEAMFVRVRS